MLYLDLIFIHGFEAMRITHSNITGGAVAIVEDILREAPDDRNFRTVSGRFITICFDDAAARKSKRNHRNRAKNFAGREQLYRNEPPGTNSYNYMKPHLTRTAIATVSAMRVIIKVPLRNLNML
jgi:hypothetical protein